MFILLLVFSVKAFSIENKESEKLTNKQLNIIVKSIKMSKVKSSINNSPKNHKNSIANVLSHN